jgi:hypothetical protein
MEGVFEPNEVEGDHASGDAETMSDRDGAWDDLYVDPDPPSRRQLKFGQGSNDQLTSLDFFMAVDGIVGVVRVAEDGVLLDHLIQGDASHAGKVTAYVGAAANQIGRVIQSGELEYAAASIGEERLPLMIMPEQDTFVGLLLAENISPTHIAAKLNISGTS